MSKTTTLALYVEKKERSKKKVKNGLSLGFFLGPYAICFAMFFVFPLVYGLIISFFKFDGKSMFPSEFVDIQNYIDIFTKNKFLREFWPALKRTIVFDLIIVPICLVVPLGLAMIINVKPPGYKVFRCLIYLPGIFPLTATGLILLKMFAYRNGFINNVFDVSIDWFAGDPMNAWFMVGLFCVWGGIGGNFIILTAALENVDKSLYEASKMDGANAWHRFLNVTLPGIRPQLTMCLFTTLIGYMNLYGQTFILLGGSSMEETLTAVYVIQNLLLSGTKAYGYAASLSIILGSIIGCMSAIQMFATRDRKGGNKHAKAFLAWKESR